MLPVGRSCRYYAAEDLYALGMDRLKEALQALGMKCGGTLEQRAARLFSVKGKAPDEIDPKLKVTGFRPATAGGRGENG